MGEFEEETFEQSAHTSDGFGGQRYEAPNGGFRNRSFARAEPSRMVPFVGLHPGYPVALDGSPRARRRAKMLRIFTYLQLALVIAVLVLMAFRF